MPDIDWSKSMNQTFEYYIVSPDTWLNSKKIDFVKSCSISRDLETDTLGSATLDISESLGEAYVRIYLVAIQNGYTKKVPLGTFLVQTPGKNFDGKMASYSIDAYSPLTELKEKLPPIGYTILKNTNIMQQAYYLARDNMRAPVIESKSDKLLTGDFVANSDDTWLTFISDLAMANDSYLSIDENGYVLFEPYVETESMRPVWTYNDDNSSILGNTISLDRDMYGIPNVVEVVYTDASHHFSVVAKNEDVNSPTSIVNRGREIVYREVNPELGGIPTYGQLEIYARSLLKKSSSIECTLQYTHGYCPVRIGDCVRINYERAGFNNVKGKVVSQSIDCSAGCQVTETVKFSSSFWEG